jgi:serine/threonine protein kinase
MSEPNAQPMHDSVVHPEFIGGYRIRSLIGEGGFGYVYLAEQSKPVRRLVALKVLKPGVDSPRAIARFQAEQQALALMEHVNVAHVYDAGVTEHGRPYFAMEYIDGLSIIDYCNRERMTVNDRIRLFIAVCDGVQHAHARGIIHRDLKPTNIVVSTVTTPTPKVIDFGIAKAIDGNMADAADTINMADLTQNGQLIGTATYASPEQIMGVIDGIDARTDVYSLGIVLAELLAGALPLDLRGLRGALLTQTAVFADPTLPSAIPDSMPPERAQLVAADRSTTVQALKNALRGDIDAIVSKAIEKEPDQRYSSAIEMSADLVRALHHQPIRARHAGRIYRLRKFARRRKRTIVISSLISIALVCALGLAIFRSLDAADARGESFAAIKERADAQAATVDMLELLVGLLRDDFTESAPGTRRMDLKTRLEQISAGGSNLAIDARLEGDLRLHLGRAFLSLRDFARAENEATRCVDLASREGLNDPLLVFRGALLLAAIERESGDLVRSRATLAELHNRILLLEATADRRKLDSMEVASLHSKHALESGLTALALGEADQAVANLNESIDRSPARSVGHIATMNAARTAKIDALLALGRPRDAELLAHELLATQITVLPSGHRWIAATRSALGESLYLQGRGEEAEPLLVSSDAMLSAALSSESELLRASRRRLDELTRRLGRPVRATPELPPLTAERRAVDNTDKN